MLGTKTTPHAMLRRHRWTLRPGHRLRIDCSTVPIPRDDLPIRPTCR
jgi:hypothetical protein